jgi:peptidoglycan/xylan/chitin deacetylase (PgdA/CDA1 family)
MLTFDDAYADLATYAFPALEAAGMRATVFVVTDCLGRGATWDDGEVSGFRLLDSADVREWSRRGIEFGAHTRSHPDLRALADDDLKTEIEGSADDLERILDQEVAAFAYPFGRYDERSLAVVRARFDLGFSTLEGTNRRSDPHQLERTMVQQADTALDINARVRLGYSPPERARRKLAIWMRRLVPSGRKRNTSGS